MWKTLLFLLKHESMPLFSRHGICKKKESVTSVSGCPQIHFNFDSNMLIKLWIISLKQNHPFCIYVEVTAWTGYIYIYGQY